MLLLLLFHSSERERALEKQNFCLKEEIKILKGTFAKASEDEVNGKADCYVSGSVMRAQW